MGLSVLLTKSNNNKRQWQLKTFCYHHREKEREREMHWELKIGSAFERLKVNLFTSMRGTIEIVPYHEKSKRRTWSSSTCCCCCFFFLFHLSFIVLLFFCSLLITHLHARIPFYLNGVNSWWVHNSWDSLFLLIGSHSILDFIIWREVRRESEWGVFRILCCELSLMLTAHPSSLKN